MKVGVISNPRSQRNRTEMARMRELIARRGLSHGEIDSMAAVPDILRRFAGDGVDALAVSGGDGTVQAVLTALLNDGERPPPRLAVLPAGMTNLIAADVGMRGHPVEGLAALLDADGGAGAEIRRRPVLSLRLRKADQPVHGMFLGTAGFYRAVMMVRRRVHTLGAERNLAAGLGIAASVAKLLLGRGGGDLSRGEALRIDRDGKPGELQDYLLCMATTLDRFIMRLSPFWGAGAEPLRYTAVRYPPQRLACALLPLLRGRPRQWMAAAGYESGRAAELRLQLSCPIVFDGEIFQPDPREPVVLRADRHVEFIRVAA
jgi:hypothetical protein